MSVISGNADAILEALPHPASLELDSATDGEHNKVARLEPTKTNQGNNDTQENDKRLLTSSKTHDIGVLVNLDSSKSQIGSDQSTILEADSHPQETENGQVSLENTTNSLERADTEPLELTSAEDRPPSEDGKAVEPQPQVQNSSSSTHGYYVSSEVADNDYDKYESNIVTSEDPSHKRVKLYKMNDAGHWEDQGTGIVHFTSWTNGVRIF